MLVLWLALLQAIAPLVHAHPDRASALSAAGIHVHAVDDDPSEFDHVTALTAPRLPHPVIEMASGLAPDNKGWVFTVLLCALTTSTVLVTQKRRDVAASASLPLPPHLRPATRAPPTC